MMVMRRRRRERMMDTESRKAAVHQAVLMGQLGLLR